MDEITDLKSEKSIESLVKAKRKEYKQWSEWLQLHVAWEDKCW